MGTQAALCNLHKIMYIFSYRYCTICSTIVPVQKGEGELGVGGLEPTEDIAAQRGVGRVCGTYSIIAQT